MHITVLTWTFFTMLSGATFMQENSLSTDEEKAAPPSPETVRCIRVNRIQDYQVEGDFMVRFRLNFRQDAILFVEKTCRGIGYHDFIRYVPSNNRLCARFDHLITRDGARCTIKEIVLVPQAMEIPDNWVSNNSTGLTPDNEQN